LCKTANPNRWLISLIMKNKQLSAINAASPTKPAVSAWTGPEDDEAYYIDPRTSSQHLSSQRYPFESDVSQELLRKAEAKRARKAKRE